MPRPFLASFLALTAYFSPVVSQLVSTLAGGGADGVTRCYPGCYGAVGNGVGTNALFYRPYGVGADGSGNVYIADTESNRIRLIAPDRTVTTLAGLTSGAASSQDGVGSNAGFISPAGLAADTTGNVYVLASSLRSVAPDATVSTFGSVSPSCGSASGVAVDSSGNVYTACSLVFRYTDVTCISGSCVRNRVQLAASITSATGPVAVDSSGNVYVVVDGNRVQAIAAGDQTVTTLAGGGAAGSASGSNNGVGTNALFFNITGIAVDRWGIVYAADTPNHRIRLITPGGVVTTLAGGGTDGITSGSVNGVGTAALFNMPQGVAVDAAGTVFTTESENHKVRLVYPQVCASGTFRLATDSSSACTLCPAGTFSSTSGSTSCSTCAVGFVSTAGSSSCVAVPSATIAATASPSAFAPTLSAQRSSSATPSLSLRRSPSSSGLATGTPTGLRSPTILPATRSNSPAASSTKTSGRSTSPTPSGSRSRSGSASPRISLSPRQTPTVSTSPSESTSPSASDSTSASASVSPSASVSVSASGSSTASPSRDGGTATVTTSGSRGPPTRSSNATRSSSARTSLTPSTVRSRSGSAAATLATQTTTFSALFSSSGSPSASNLWGATATRAVGSSSNDASASPSASVARVTVTPTLSACVSATGTASGWRATASAAWVNEGTRTAAVSPSIATVTVSTTASVTASTSLSAQASSTTATTVSLTSTASGTPTVSPSVGTSASGSASLSALFSALPRSSTTSTASVTASVVTSASANAGSPTTSASPAVSGSTVGSRTNSASVSGTVRSSACASSTVGVVTASTTNSPSRRASPSASVSGIGSVSVSRSARPSASASVTGSALESRTLSTSVSLTASLTSSLTSRASAVLTSSAPPSLTPSAPSGTVAASKSTTPRSSFTLTIAASPSPSGSPSSSLSPAISRSVSSSVRASRSPSTSASSSVTNARASRSPTVSPSTSAVSSRSVTVLATASIAQWTSTAVNSASGWSSGTASGTVSLTRSARGSGSSSGSPRESATALASRSNSASPSVSASPLASAVPSGSPSVSRSSQASQVVPSNSPSVTNAASPTVSHFASVSANQSSTPAWGFSASGLPSPSPSVSATLVSTSSPTIAAMPTANNSATQTVSVAASNSRVPDVSPSGQSSSSASTSASYSPSTTTRSSATPVVSPSGPATASTTPSATRTPTRTPAMSAVSGPWTVGNELAGVSFAVVPRVVSALTLSRPLPVPAAVPSQGTSDAWSDSAHFSIVSTGWLPTVAISGGVPGGGVTAGTLVSAAAPLALSADVWAFAPYADSISAAAARGTPYASSATGGGGPSEAGGFWMQFNAAAGPAVDATAALNVTERAWLDAAAAAGRGGSPAPLVSADGAAVSAAPTGIFLRVTSATWTLSGMPSNASAYSRVVGAVGSSHSITVSAPSSPGSLFTSSPSAIVAAGALRPGYVYRVSIALTFSPRWSWAAADAWPATVGALGGLGSPAGIAAAAWSLVLLPSPVSALQTRAPLVVVHAPSLGATLTSAPTSGVALSTTFTLSLSASALHDTDGVLFPAAAPLVAVASAALDRYPMDPPIAAAIAAAGVGAVDTANAALIAGVASLGSAPLAAVYFYVDLLFGTSKTDASFSAVISAGTATATAAIAAAATGSLLVVRTPPVSSLFDFRLVSASSFIGTTFCCSKTGPSPGAVFSAQAALANTVAWPLGGAAPVLGGASLAVTFPDSSALIAAGGDSDSGSSSVSGSSVAVVVLALERDSDGGVAVTSTQVVLDALSTWGACGSAAAASQSSCISALVDSVALTATGCATAAAAGGTPASGIACAGALAGALANATAYQSVLAAGAPSAAASTASAVVSTARTAATTLLNVAANSLATRTAADAALLTPASNAIVVLATLAGGSSVGASSTAAAALTAVITSLASAASAAEASAMLSLRALAAADGIVVLRAVSAIVATGVSTVGAVSAHATVASTVTAVMVAAPASTTPYSYSTRTPNDSPCGSAIAVAVLRAGGAQLRSAGDGIVSLSSSLPPCANAETGAAGAAAVAIAPAPAPASAALPAGALSTLATTLGGATTVDVSIIQWGTSPSSERAGVTYTTPLGVKRGGGGRRAATNADPVGISAAAFTAANDAALAAFTLAVNATLALIPALPTPTDLFPARGLDSRVLTITARGSAVGSGETLVLPPDTRAQVGPAGSSTRVIVTIPLRDPVQGASLSPVQVSALGGGALMYSFSCPRALQPPGSTVPAFVSINGSSAASTRSAIRVESAYGLGAVGITATTATSAAALPDTVAAVTGLSISLFVSADVGYATAPGVTPVHILSVSCGTLVGTRSFACGPGAEGMNVTFACPAIVPVPTCVVWNTSINTWGVDDNLCAFAGWAPGGGAALCACSVIGIDVALRVAQVAAPPATLLFANSAAAIKGVTVAPAYPFALLSLIGAVLVGVAVGAATGHSADLTAAKTVYAALARTTEVRALDALISVIGDTAAGALGKGERLDLGDIGKSALLSSPSMTALHASRGQRSARVHPLPLPLNDATPASPHSTGGAVNGETRIIMPPTTVESPASSAVSPEGDAITATAQQVQPASGDGAQLMTNAAVGALTPAAKKEGSAALAPSTSSVVSPRKGGVSPRKGGVSSASAPPTGGLRVLFRGNAPNADAALVVFAHLTAHENETPPLPLPLPPLPPPLAPPAPPGSNHRASSSSAHSSSKTLTLLSPLKGATPLQHRIVQNAQRAGRGAIIAATNVRANATKALHAMPGNRLFASLAPVRALADFDPSLPRAARAIVVGIAALAGGLAAASLGIPLAASTAPLFLQPALPVPAAFALVAVCALTALIVGYILSALWRAGPGTAAVAAAAPGVNADAELRKRADTILSALPTRILALLARAPDAFSTAKEDAMPSIARVVEDAFCDAVGVERSDAAAADDDDDDGRSSASGVSNADDPERADSDDDGGETADKDAQMADTARAALRDAVNADALLRGTEDESGVCGSSNVYSIFFLLCLLWVALAVVSAGLARSAALTASLIGVWIGGLALALILWTPASLIARYVSGIVGAPAPGPEFEPTIGADPIELPHLLSPAVDDAWRSAGARATPAAATRTERLASFLARGAGSTAPTAVWLALRQRLAAAAYARVLLENVGGAAALSALNKTTGGGVAAGGSVGVGSGAGGAGAGTPAAQEKTPLFMTPPSGVIAPPMDTFLKTQFGASARSLAEGGGGVARNGSAEPRVAPLRNIGVSEVAQPVSLPDDFAAARAVAAGFGVGAGSSNGDSRAASSFGDRRELTGDVDGVSNTNDVFLAPPSRIPHEHSGQVHAHAQAHPPVSAAQLSTADAHSLYSNALHRSSPVVRAQAPSPTEFHRGAPVMRPTPVADPNYRRAPPPVYSDEGGEQRRSAWLAPSATTQDMPETMLPGARRGHDRVAQRGRLGAVAAQSIL